RGAELEVSWVAECDSRQSILANPHRGQISPRIGAFDRANQLSAVLQLHVHRSRFSDDVCVGHDQAVGSDYHTRSDCADVRNTNDSGQDTTNRILFSELNWSRCG